MQALPVLGVYLVHYIALFRLQLRPHETIIALLVGVTFVRLTAALPLYSMDVIDVRVCNRIGDMPRS
jgi:hypothetical protein